MKWTDRETNEQTMNSLSTLYACIFKRACYAAPAYASAGTILTRGGKDSTEAGRLLGDLPTGPAPCTLKWAQAVKEENTIYRLPLASIPSRPRREASMLAMWPLPTPHIDNTHDHKTLLQFNDALAFLNFWYANAITQLYYPGIKLAECEPNHSLPLPKLRMRTGMSPLNYRCPQLGPELKTGLYLPAPSTQGL
jgi:hypothetical protein